MGSTILDSSFTRQEIGNKQSVIENLKKTALIREMLKNKTKLVSVIILSKPFHN